MFTRTSTNIPVGDRQLLDSTTSRYPGATLADLNDDGLPELIVTGNSTDAIRPSTILWNRAGVFVETDATTLPAPGIFSNAHYDRDVQRIDVNQDGLPDLVLVGGQNTDLSSGWFVQVLVNHGNRQFVDETADRVPPGEGGGGTEGMSTSAPAAQWVRVIDFNQDGAPDFSVEMQKNGAMRLPADTPLIWLNDGTGHFSTLKVRDFVAPGEEDRLGLGHLVATRNGLSFISTTYNANSGGWPLSVKGLLATRPYRVTTRSSAPRD